MKHTAQDAPFRAVGQRGSFGTTLRLLCWAAAGLFVSSTALAAETQSTFLKRWGLAMSVGGGITGFTGKAPTDKIGVGGNWEARISLGTKGPFAVEAAYVGAAQGMETLGGIEDDAMLVANGVETNLRMNLLQGRMLTPYALAGIGWRHYAISGEVTETSSVRDTDDVLETPLGAGVSYRLEPVILDLRGTFRPAFDSDLIRGAANDTDRGLDNWTARLSVGWEL
jgi:hypothetical protein